MISKKKSISKWNSYTLCAFVCSTILTGVGCTQGGAGSAGSATKDDSDVNSSIDPNSPASVNLSMFTAIPGLSSAQIMQNPQFQGMCNNQQILNAQWKITLADFALRQMCDPGLRRGCIQGTQVININAKNKSANITGNSCNSDVTADSDSMTNCLATLGLQASYIATATQGSVTTYEAPVLLFANNFANMMLGSDCKLMMLANTCYNAQGGGAQQATATSATQGPIVPTNPTYNPTDPSCQQPVTATNAPTCDPMLPLCDALVAGSNPLDPSCSQASSQPSPAIGGATALVRNPAFNLTTTPVAACQSAGAAAISAITSGAEPPPIPPTCYILASTCDPMQGGEPTAAGCTPSSTTPQATPQSSTTQGVGAGTAAIQACWQGVINEAFKEVNTPGGTGLPSSTDTTTMPSNLCAQIPGGCN